jgi:hypothetical protein
VVDDRPLRFKCGTHGNRLAAVVCRHILEARDADVGFIENSSDPNDLQSWCNACEEMFLREGGLTTAFENFNDRKIICDFCYVALRERFGN